ncbi:hypothetical protein V1527DRAFT_477776 [Lipomyces starkeyi]
MRDDDSDRIDEHNVQCDCLLFRKYYLPCRHILLADRTYEILTEDPWNNFVVMFENRGFDVYEGRGQEPAREGDRGEMGAPARRALTLKGYAVATTSLRRVWILSSEKTRSISGPDLCRERVPTSLLKKATTYIINVERKRRKAGGEQ